MREGLSGMFELFLFLKKIKPKKTPLQISMKKLAGKLVYVAIFVSLLVLILGIIRGQDFKTMILTSLAL